MPNQAPQHQWGEGTHHYNITRSFFQPDIQKGYWHSHPNAKTGFVTEWKEKGEGRGMGMEGEGKGKENGKGKRRGRLDGPLVSSCSDTHTNINMCPS